LTTASVAWPQNLIRNGGFEAWGPAPAPPRDAGIPFPKFGADGSPVDWNGAAEITPGVHSSDVHSDTAIYCDAVVKHAGRCSVRVENRNITDIVGLYTRIPVEPNTVYRVRCWERGANIVTVFDGVLFWARYGPTSGWDQHNTVVASRPPNHAGTFDWSLHEFNVETGSDAQIMDITLQLRNASGTAWFDDAEVTKLRSIVRVPTY
jgi:hypothetical protein